MPTVRFTRPWKFAIDGVTVVEYPADEPTEVNDRAVHVAREMGILVEKRPPAEGPKRQAKAK